MPGVRGMPGGGGTDGGSPEGEKCPGERVCCRQKLDISDPALLLALLDAYEVTRDEGMLQVLDVVGRI
ncbi:MAG: hypothetical protein ACLUOS_12740 [Odoribacter splanchnicus]